MSTHDTASAQTATSTDLQTDIQAEIADAERALQATPTDDEATAAYQSGRRRGLEVALELLTQLSQTDADDVDVEVAIRESTREKPERVMCGGRP